MHGVMMSDDVYGTEVSAMLQLNCYLTDLTD